MNVIDDCGSGLSRESSRDDINSECDQQFEYEQRFRVDRKKLETMMTNSPEFGEAAQEFFDRIETETDTCVIYHPQAGDDRRESKKVDNSISTLKKG